MGGEVRLPQAELNVGQLRQQGWNTSAPTLEDVLSGRGVLLRGHGGETVRLMQLRLMELGYDVGPEDADGKFGPRTEAGLREFQRRNASLLSDDPKSPADDGKLGRRTGGLLFGTAVDERGRPLRPALGPDRAAPGDRVVEDRRTDAEARRIAVAVAPNTAVLPNTAVDVALTEDLARERARALARESRPVPQGANRAPAAEATAAESSSEALVDVELTAFSVRRQPDAYFGTANNATIRDYRGRVVTREADVAAAGVDLGEVNLVGGSARIGNSDRLGADIRGGVDLSAHVGGYVARSYNEQTGEGSLAARAGAYTGADASYEWNLGFRYFGFGTKHSAGLGAGGEVSVNSSTENRRISAGGFVRGGLGVTTGHGVQGWFDWGQVVDDAKWVGNKIASAWNRIGWSPSTSSTFR